ncbi:EF-hand domain-containing protein [Martelella lutilitoris]|uniref:EF-hand domain-containing protein n=1 Tax=Martelella lutilitoris TaxID=2583532 RepID=A0A5C4JS64_9HYPH|nr:EF-hand domain-containing protein [Martelella lutilitoris]TNB48233.1 EF-hand domain-containing protein [Martelella lutilitoris]
MKRRTIFAAGLVAALIGGAAVPALAAGPDDSWGGRGQGPRQMMTDCDGPQGAARGPGGRQGMMQRGNDQNGFAQGNRGPGRMAMRGNDDSAYGRGMMQGQRGGPQGDFGPGGMRGPGTGPGNGPRGAAPTAGPQMMGDLGQYDKNGDGYLSLDEFEAFQVEVGRPMFERHFQYLDSDGDGKVAVSQLPVPGAGPQRPFAQGPAGNQGQQQPMPRGMGNPNN